VTEEDFGPEDLELQRRLDAAFSQTRARRDFEDQLWAKLAGGSRRRQWARIPPVSWVPHDAWPALGVVAAVLVLVVAVVPLLVRGHSSSGAAISQSSSASSAGAGPALPKTTTLGPAAQGPGAAFGALPTPTLANPDRPAPAASVIPYYGPAALSVTVSVTATLASLPLTLQVFRFTEPTTRQATSTAKAYHGQPVTSSSRPFREPRFQVTVAKPDSGSADPLPDAAALAATDAFLASRKLSWAWSPLREVVDEGPVALVHYVHQFDVAGYGQATQVDQLGAPAGADVAVRSDGKVFQATVPMQLQVRSAAYPARAAEKAVEDALGVVPPSPAGLTPLPQVQLSRADLVYVAVEAGPYGYFEPAVLFSGAFTSGSVQYEKRVLVPALDAANLR
jgi:hypothetical protein